MPPTSPAPVLRLADRAPSLEARLVEWADLPSGSDDTQGLLRMAARLGQDFGELRGARVERIQLPDTQAPALRVSMRPGLRRRVLCSGHFDTVYGRGHAFRSCSRLQDGRLRGPGVADMKGGLVIMLEALRAFEECPGSENLGWDALLTPDEETGSSRSEAVLRDAARRAIAGLVFEPARANGDLVRTRMGTGVLVATAHGRSAHAAAMPPAGRNAIVALADFVRRADALPATLPGTLLNVGSISGGGAVNVVPDLAEARLNVRATSRAAADALLGALQSLADEFNRREGFKFILSGTFERQPKECGPVEERLFRDYQAACASLQVPPPGWQDVGGGSDGNLLFEEGLPNLDGLGVVGGNLHSEQEYCEPSSLVPRAQAAALLLHTLAGSW